jgi:hypothetical protein
MSYDNMSSVSQNVLKFHQQLTGEESPPLFTGKLLIKFQNILRNTTQVIIRHSVKILFFVISSPLPVKRGGSLSFLTIFTFAVPELLDLI